MTRSATRGRAGRRWLAVAAALIALAGCAGPVEGPALFSQGGRGPLAIEVDSRDEAPAYHRPAAWWRSNHMALLAGGAGGYGADFDYSPRECLVCHNPRTSCNRCHAYVGAPPVLEDFET